MRRRPKQERRSPWKKRQRRILIVMSAFLILFGGVATFRLSVSNRIAIEYDKIRTAGLPITAHELEVWFENAPVTLDGAELYAKTFEGDTVFKVDR